MKTDHSHHYCIILAGGIGSRLWPYSTIDKPKQFLDLFGTGLSMLQFTYRRFLKILPPENIFVSTYSKYKDLVRQQLPEMDEMQIIDEPVQLSTAPAVSLTACCISALHPDASSVIITPADQIITNQDDFCEQVSQGFTFVDNESYFLAMGVKATHPETTYGYLQTGELMDNGYSRVKSFTEKPSEEFAKFFVESGEFYWSTGLFMVGMPTLINALQEDYPDILRVIERYRAHVPFEDTIAFVESRYPRARHRSIDMFILEENRNVCIKPCTFGWKDIGSWQDLYKVSQRDIDGNVTANTHTSLYNCQGNVVMSLSGKTIMMQDMQDYLVIERNNMILICKKDDTAQIRRIMTDAEVKYGKNLMD